MKTMIRNLWDAITGRKLRRTIDDNKAAADALDHAVREMLEK